MSKVVGEGQGLNEQPRHGQGGKKTERKRRRRKLYNLMPVAILAQAFRFDAIFCVCSLVGFRVAISQPHLL